MSLAILSEKDAIRSCLGADADYTVGTAFVYWWVFEISVIGGSTTIGCMHYHKDSSEASLLSSFPHFSLSSYVPVVLLAMVGKIFLREWSGG